MKNKTPAHDGPIILTDPKVKEGNTHSIINMLENRVVFWVMKIRQLHSAPPYFQAAPS